MSKENVEVARRAYEAFNRRDMEAFLAEIDPDVEFVTVWVEGDSYHGHDGVRRWWGDLFGVYPDWTNEVLDVRDLGDDRLIASLRAHGHGADSGVPIDQVYWHVVQLREWKAVWWRTYARRARGRRFAWKAHAGGTITSLAPEGSLVFSPLAERCSTREDEKRGRMSDRETFQSWARPGAPLPPSQVLSILRDVLLERSPALGNHSSVVARLCEVIATTVGLPDDQREPLVQAALLHDVGKLSLPDSILEKPGPLSADEWKRMRRHTILGERVLVAVGLEGKVVEFVRSSHERIDGCGYPDGLAGEEIPLGARIVNVCDSFDAMTTSRPYRPMPMSSSGALDELDRASGTQFDPIVVDALTEHYRANVASFGHHGLGHAAVETPAP